jgi:hypothetical protein
MRVIGAERESTEQKPKCSRVIRTWCAHSETRGRTRMSNVVLFFGLPAHRRCLHACATPRKVSADEVGAYRVEAISMTLELGSATALGREVCDGLPESVLQAVQRQK